MRALYSCTEHALWAGISSVISSLGVKGESGLKTKKIHKPTEAGSSGGVVTFARRDVAGRRLR